MKDTNANHGGRTGADGAERLAVLGGTPANPRPRPALQRWGEAERTQLDAMVAQPSLFYWRGPQTALLVERFRQAYPFQHVMPCSSGTAAIHIALLAADLGPGDEVITAPITDMGTAIGILYQQAVPVFADLEADRYTLDVADVRAKITPRTKAIVAVHLCGNPCRLAELRELADRHSLVLVEDCAQAWGALYRGRPVGTLGHVGCYSLNDFKHIACGDGGLVGSNDERIGPRLQRCGDKAYDRVAGTRAPEFLAPNYRISEPQSAVAAAQMLRMESITSRRAELGLRLSAALADVPGVRPHASDPADRCTFWFYFLRLNLAELTCDRQAFVAALAGEGVPASAGYIPGPVYAWPVFQNHSFFGGRWPLREAGLTDMDYRRVRCPEAEAILETGVRIEINQAMDNDYIAAVADAVRKAARHYARR